MSFFERLSGNWDDPTIEGVARNLQAVLNAKQGHAAAVESFGLGSYDRYFATSPLVAELIREMLEQIRRFEPRLREPSIVLAGVDQELWARFSLKGVCDGRPCAFTIHFHTMFRHVRVLPGGSSG